MAHPSAISDFIAARARAPVAAPDAAAIEEEKAATTKKAAAEQSGRVVEAVEGLGEIITDWADRQDKQAAEAKDSETAAKTAEREQASRLAEAMARLAEATGRIIPNIADLIDARAAENVTASEALRSEVYALRGEMAGAFAMLGQKLDEIRNVMLMPNVLVRDEAGKPHRSRKEI